MKLFRKRDYISYAIGFIVSAIIITIFYSIIKEDIPLPKIQPCDIIDKTLLDPSIAHVCKYHKIADFELTNQNSQVITEEDYKDKIYIADFFFTTCQDICPIMTNNMYLLQEEFKLDNDILLLSHTVTPEIDTIEQLKRYSIEKKVNDKKWNLVTGDKKQIYELARKSYLIGIDNEYNMNSIIHTENFVLVDKEKNIRGIYDGTSKMSIDSLVNDVKTLKKEYNEF